MNKKRQFLDRNTIITIDINKRFTPGTGGYNLLKQYDTVFRMLPVDVKFVGWGRPYQSNEYLDLFSIQLRRKIKHKTNKH